MSEIQAGCGSHLERCVIGHPFNPPHLISLVEIVGATKTSEDTIQRGSEFYTAMGKRPDSTAQRVVGASRQPSAGRHYTQNLLSRFLRRRQRRRRRHRVGFGAGARWGITGNMLLNHLGGGEGGIEHFLEQFTGPLTAWWKALGQPVLTPETAPLRFGGPGVRAAEVT